MSKLFNYSFWGDCRMSLPCRGWGCHISLFPAATSNKAEHVFPVATCTNTHSAHICISKYMASHTDQQEQTYSALTHHNTNSANGFILIILARQDENSLLKNIYIQIHTHVHIRADLKHLICPVTGPWMTLVHPGEVASKHSPTPPSTYQERGARIFTGIRDNKHKLEKRDV